MKRKKLHRAITHQDYGNSSYEKNFKNSFNHVPIGIHTHKVWRLSSKLLKQKDGVYYVDETIMSVFTTSKDTALWGGGIMLYGLLLFLWRGGGENFYIWTTARIIMVSIFGFFFLFFAVYYFTMPKKENIYNRMAGTITFTGSYWGKNITMPFNKILFHASTGGEDGTGAYMLQIVRPTDRTFAESILGDDCYQSISLITWYMDKNRPLPPGTLFDPYREADFERRKAEGFPPPLYPSQIFTPEATKAQQKERDKYWRDSDYLYS